MKTHTLPAAQISTTTANQLITTSAALKMKSTAMDNAGQRTSHVVTLQPSTALLKMTLALNTAVVIMEKNAVRQEKNANQKELSAAPMTRRNATENVFQRKICAAQTTLHTASTLTLVKNTAVTNQMDTTGANGLTHVKNTAADTITATTKFGVTSPILALMNVNVAMMATTLANA